MCGCTCSLEDIFLERERERDHLKVVIEVGPNINRPVR